MRRRIGSLTELDRAAWAAYAGAVRPLPGRALPSSLAPSLAPPPDPPPPQAEAAPVPAAARRRSAMPPQLVTGIQPPGLDNASWARFRGGRLRPARTLDLHGKTVQAAFHALEQFLYAAHAEHLRCVEIITGRGSGETGGAIRRELPHWLGLPSIRPMVLAAAHPHARNEGSTRILLRRAGRGRG